MCADSRGGAFGHVDGDGNVHDNSDMGRSMGHVDGDRVASDRGETLGLIGDDGHVYSDRGENMGSLESADGSDSGGSDSGDSGGDSDGGDSGGDSDGSCFITTACSLARGLPDNCLELRTLRDFRARILLPTSEGRAAINEYGRIAPRIVKAVNSRRDALQIWDENFKDIEIAVGLVRSGEHSRAFDHYKGMVQGLQKYLD